VRFSTHAIGNYEQIQWLHDAKTIFIVRTLLPDIALPTADNAHKSPFPDGRANEWSRCTPGACWDQ
jgi:biotin synthase-like enzyme